MWEMPVENIEVISLIVAIIGSVAVIINSRLIAKRRDVYTPAYNSIDKNTNSIEYDRNVGEFAKIWESLDGHIQDTLAENDLHGWLVMFDGRIEELNRFLYNYQLKLESMSDSSEYIIESDDGYFFDIGGERGQILLEDFINHHGCEIITTEEKGDLWNKLRRNSEKGYHHTEIKNWGPTGSRIDLLWECREATYRNNPNFIGSPDESYRKAVQLAREAHDHLGKRV